MKTDHYIREVRVNYISSDKKQFSIRQANDVAEFVRHFLTDNSREHCFALFLDGSHKVANYSLLSIGTANAAMVHARELFQRAVISGAISIVIAHNHPSGEISPSSEDKVLTKQIKEAGALLGIPLLDHVIVANEKHFSFCEEGIL